MLIVAGHAHVDPERRAALLASLDEPLRRTRTEGGCLAHAVAADPVEPDRVTIFERWESQQHLDAHLAGVARTAQPMPGVRSVDVMKYEAVAVGPV